MKNWTIGKRIVVGFSMVILVAAVLGVFSWFRLVSIKKNSDQIVKDCLPGVSLFGQIESVLKGNYICLLSHVLTTNDQEMLKIEVEIKGQREANSKNYKDYEAKMQDKKDQELFAVIQTCRPGYTKAIDDALKLSREGKKAEAMAILEKDLKPAYAHYLTAIAATVDYNQKSADAGSARIQNAVTTSKTGILIGLITAILAGIGIALVIIRGTSKVLNSIASSLSEGSNSVAAAATQVSASSQTLAEGSSEQAASIEETSSSLEEMSSMTKRNADNAQKANDLARQARGAADNGANDMQAMSQAMNEIKTSSDDIGKIIKTIDEIAFQTNILALNAAVEAARAGEAGMGFAVVADEVRNLAQRSAQAAKETAGKIEGAIAKTAQGVEISTKVGAQLQEIVTKVRQVDELISEVSAASKEQSQGIEQVNTAVGQMDAVTQSTAAAAEESASAAEELNAQAETLKSSVYELMRLVGGQKLAHTTETSAKPARHTPVHKPVATPKAKVVAHMSVHPRFAKQAAELVTPETRSAIPMEGDFKNFNS